MHQFINILVALMISVSFSPVVAAKKNRYVPTPQEIHDEYCRDSVLTHAKESKSSWEEYVKECRPRAANPEKFEKVADEYMKQCVSRSSPEKARVAFLKCEVAEDQLRTNYLTLYELERQQLFVVKAVKMRKLVKIRCPRKANAKNLRRAFAECHIHIGADDRDGYFSWFDSLPKSIHQQVDSYKSSLKRQGLWTE